MLKLYIIRHAQAKSGDSRYTDHENPLTESGEDYAFEVGSQLGELEANPNIILTSTARRALMTAQYLAKGLRSSESIIVPIGDLYNAPAETILKVLKKYAVSTDVMIVAHNPGISDFANRILGTKGISMDTCEVIQVELPVGSWSDVEWGLGSFI